MHNTRHSNMSSMQSENHASLDEFKSALYEHARGSGEKGLHMDGVNCPYCGTWYDSDFKGIEGIVCTKCGWRPIGSLYYREGPHPVDYYMRSKIPHRYICASCWAPSYELIHPARTKLNIRAHGRKMILGLIGALLGTSIMWGMGLFSTPYFGGSGSAGDGYLLGFIRFLAPWALNFGLILFLLGVQGKARCGRCGQTWKPLIVRKRHRTKPVMGSERELRRGDMPPILIEGYETWQEYIDGTWAICEDERKAARSWLMSVEGFLWFNLMSQHRGVNQPTGWE